MRTFKVLTMQGVVELIDADSYTIEPSGLLMFSAAREDDRVVWPAAFASGQWCSVMECAMADSVRRAA